MLNASKLSSGTIQKYPSHITVMLSIPFFDKVMQKCYTYSMVISMETLMPTQNPRINITFDVETAKTLTDLSHQEHKSVSSLAKELIIEALERREDRALSAIAEVRDTPHAKRVKHDDAWK